MDMHISVATRLLVLGLLCAGGAGAQFPQYTAPGSLAAPATPVRERVETGAENARWDLGGVKVDPRIWLGETGYNDNVFRASEDSEKVSDLTATVGAGLVAYSRLGSDVMVSAYLLPEYTWWQDLEQLREEQLSFGAGVFGFFNRMTLVVDARRDERQRFLNSEVLVPFDILARLASLRVDVDFRGPLELFAALEGREFEHRGEALPLAVELLDRDEALARLGLAYRFRSGLRIGLGAEQSEADFATDGAGRSNTTLGPVLEIGYDKGDLDLGLSAVLREIEFETSPRRTVSELTGSARIGWQVGHRLQIDAYGGRSLVYSVEASDQLFTEERVGLSLGTPWGRRFHLRGFAEAGTNDYRSISAEPGTRAEDVTSFGGDLDFEIAKRMLLTAGVTSTDIDSSQPALDRSFTVVRLGLRLGGDPRPW